MTGSTKSGDGEGRSPMSPGEGRSPLREVMYAVRTGFTGPGDLPDEMKQEMRQILEDHFRKKGGVLEGVEFDKIPAPPPFPIGKAWIHRAIGKGRIPTDG